MTQRRSIRASQALVDTSAFFALIDTGEHQHGDAVAIATGLASARWDLFTTNFVLAETHALFLSRRGRDAAQAVLQTIERSSAAVIRVSAADERRARDLITQYDDKDFALFDATSFAVMERLGIAAAFAFDRHFAQYGLWVLKAADF